MSETKLGSIVALAATAIGAAPVIDESALIPLGVVVFGVLLAVRITWKSAERLTRVTDRLEQLERRLNQIDRRKESPPKG